MDQQTPSAVLLPPRVAWFAVWRWKRRSVAVLFALLLSLVYPLSIGPAVYLVERRPELARTVAVVYRPVLWAWHRSSSLIDTVVYDYANWWSQTGWFNVLIEHGVWEFGEDIVNLPNTPKPDLLLFLLPDSVQSAHSAE
jgi:hypothetical protein